MPDKVIRQEMTVKDLESLAQFAKHLHSSGRIDNEQRRLFMFAIMAGDERGNLWTIGTQTGKWYRRDGDRWAEGQPPEKLILVVPEEFFRDAQSMLDELKVEVHLKAAAIDRCPQCRAALTTDSRFCSRCGAPITRTPEGRVTPPPPPRCPHCGQAVLTTQNFCTKCGMRLR